MTSLVLGLFALVEVLGSECPSASAIGHHLRPLLRGATRGDTVTVRSADDTLIVELRSHETIIGPRVLPAVGSCDERAEAVAVVVAAWKSELDAPSLALAVTLPAHKPSPSLMWSLGASYLGTVAGGAYASGASVDVRLGKRGFRLAARIGVAGTDTRDLALGSGRASWTRAALVFGPLVDVVTRGGVRLDLHADLLAGWMFVAGHGFRQNLSDSAFDPALGGGVRLAVTKLAVEPFFDCTLVGWLRRQTVSAPDLETTHVVEIPRFDIWLRAGIAYGKH